jgi:PPOX class probable F420-dependent enzyme
VEGPTQEVPVPTLPFPDHVRDLLGRPNPAVVTTLRGDGQPVSVATWYLLEDDDRVLVNMDITRKRLQHLRADPRITLTALDEANWYTHVSLVGKVVEMRDDEGLVDIDRLSTHYRGQPYTRRDSPRVSAWIAVDRWHGWGAAAR